MTFQACIHGEPLTDAGSLCFVCDDGRLLVRRHGARATLPRLADLAALGIEPKDPFCFGHHGHAGCFVVAQPVERALEDGWEMAGLRGVLGELDDDTLLVAGRALQYAEWDRSHRFCGRCGERTTRHPENWSRACSACGHAAFPRVSPAVIMLVHKGDACLLAHAAHHAENLYSVLAGFVEPGETLEECVAREVREEVGIEVRDIRYFGNQPWPFPHSLMVGFTAAWKSGELVPDGVEILEAGWFTHDALPARIPSSISIARRLIDSFFASRAHAS